MANIPSAIKEGLISLGTSFKSSFDELSDGLSRDNISLGNRFVFSINTMKDSILSKFTGISTGITEFKNSVKIDIDTIKDNITLKFNDLYNSINNAVSTVSLKIENVKSKITEFENSLTTKIQAFEDSIVNKVLKVENKIDDINSYLSPSSENFFLKLAFVPKDGFFTESFDAVKFEFDKKFNFGEFESALKSLKNSEREIVEFKIKLPSMYGSKEVEIIDFSTWNKYKPTVFLYMRVVLWFGFIWRTYRRIPSIIYPTGG